MREDCGMISRMLVSQYRKGNIAQSCNGSEPNLLGSPNPVVLWWKAPGQTLLLRILPPSFKSQSDAKTAAGIVISEDDTV